MKFLRGPLLLLTCLISTTRAAGESLVLELQAGKSDRAGTPVSFTLPATLRNSAGFSLTRLDNRQNVAVQKTAETPPRVVWLLEEKLKAGARRLYRLVPTNSPQGKKIVTCKDNGKLLVLSVGEKPVFRYNHALVPSPNGDEPYYARSGYLHPLFAPDGTPVTDDFAPDHPHQHGVMFAWTNTTFEGRNINFWDQKARTGKIEHVAVKNMYDGPVCGGFSAAIKHIDLTAPEGAKPVLDETWTVRVYNRNDGFLFDLQSEQRAAGKSPLVINQYHYGGMAIRGHRDWLNSQAGDFLTSEGKTRANGNHSRPHWVTVHGLIGGQAYGVTIFSDPRNFRAPQPVRLHPTKPYFVFAPLVLGPFQIGPAEPYISRFRFYIDKGSPNAEHSRQLWRDLSDPPLVVNVDSR